MSWLDSLLARPPVTGWDLLDIAIVAIVVYELLKLIRGTRASQMAVAIGAIVALFYASRALGLETVNWLIRNVVGYVVFAAIVLLQTDIRRALVHFGRGPFFRFLRRVEPDEDVVEELVVGARDAGRQAHRRPGRGRAQHRPAQSPRKRHPDRRQAHLRPAGEPVPADLAAARRRGHHPGRPDRRRRVLPAAQCQSAI